jgi:PHD/YefM family antitoxin component YafN of YafNO toxin-antitoxin module
VELAPCPGAFSFMNLNQYRDQGYEVAIDLNSERRQVCVTVQDPHVNSIVYQRYYQLLAWRTMTQREFEASADTILAAAREILAREN